MKVKNIMPTIITDHIAGTAAEFEGFGFTQKHHLFDEKKSKCSSWSLKADQELRS